MTCLLYLYRYSSISNFTLMLLEDSGWYRVDYAAAEALYNYELLWGKGDTKLIMNGSIYDLYEDNRLIDRDHS